MKKTFELVHPKLKPARRIEAIKYELKKYLKRERKKSLPEGADFWDFDCRCGASAENAKIVHVSDLNKFVDGVQKQNLDSFYIEILVKPGHRQKPAG